MAGAEKIRAAKAEVEIGGNLKPLQAALAQASKKLSDFGTQTMALGAKIAGAGLAITAPFVAGLHVFAELGGAMDDVAQRTGLTVEAVTELGFAAEMAGASTEDLEKAFVGMAKIMSSAGEGSAQANEKLAALGITVEDLGKLSQDQRFELFAERISQIEDPAQRAATAMEVFGKSGAKLLPMMADGAKGIKAMREEAQRLGLSMSTEDAQNAAAVGDQIEQVGKQIKMVWFQVGAAIAPIAKEYLAIISNIVGQTINWVRENREWLALFFKVGAIIAAVGAMIIADGLRIKLVGLALGQLASFAGTLGTVFGFVFSMAFVKIALIIGVLALVAYGLYQIKDVIIGVAEKFSAWVPIVQNFAATFMEMWGGINDAVAAGDLGLAWEILVNGMKLYWARFVNWVREAWFSTKYLFIASFGDIYNQGLEIFWNMAKAIAKAFVWMGGKIVEALNAAIDLIPDWVFDVLGIDRGETQVGFDTDQLNANIDRNAADAIASGRVNERDASAELNAERERARAEETGIQGELTGRVADAAIERALREMDTSRWILPGKPGNAGMSALSGMQSVGGFNVASVLGQLGGATEDKQTQAIERSNELLTDIRGEIQQQNTAA